MNMCKVIWGTLCGICLSMGRHSKTHWPVSLTSENRSLSLALGEVNSEVCCETVSDNGFAIISWAYNCRAAEKETRIMVESLLAS